MEYKIGKVFKYRNTKLKCVKYYPGYNDCNDCYFYQWTKLCCKQKCMSFQRKDKTDVKFIQVNN